MREKTKQPKGRYIKAWADLRKEEEQIWVEEGEDPMAAVEHWFQNGDVCGYGYDEIEEDDAD